MSAVEQGFSHAKEGCKGQFVIEPVADELGRTHYHCPECGAWVVTEPAKVITTLGTLQMSNESAADGSPEA